MTAENKQMTMTEAVDRFVQDGDTVFLGGFIQQEPFAAAHEIVRQRKKDLTIHDSPTKLSFQGGKY